MSVNQNIRPITAEVKENLVIGGCDTVELAKQYGTPLYVVDELSLRTIAQEYKTAFSSYANSQILYASKALSNLAIYNILAEEGLGFVVV